MALVALMAFFEFWSASATVLCKVEPVGGKCPANQAYPAGTETHSESEEGLVLTGGFKSVECKRSAITSKNNNEGSVTETVKGVVEVFTFTECNCEVAVSEKGTLEIHTIAGTSNGTLTSTGAKVTVNCSTIFGNVHCIYVTNNTDLGTLTGTSTTGSTATMDVTATIPQQETNPLCAEESIWHAKYKVTTPDAVYVAEST